MSRADLAAPRTPQAPKRTFFGHPLGLANLAGVEMWERFSFYGMQGILVFYLYYALTDGGLGLTEASATSIVGAYGGTVYLSAILGAWVADRLLGAERALTAAATVIMLGHLSLALIPGFLGVGVGLVCNAVGSGTLKATTSSVLGDLYEPQDQRRDAGFSIYYMGVNIGALAGPLLTGLLWDLGGFHWGFGLAAVGMAIGLAQYLLLRRATLADAGHEVTNPLDRRGKVRYGLIAAAVIVVIALLAMTGVITAGRLSTIVVGVTLAATIALFTVILTSSRITREERSRVLSFIPMFIASAVFWSLFQQQFTVVALYADQRLDLSLFGWTMPPSWVQSINPHLHHRLRRRVRRDLDPARLPPAPHPDQVRAGHDLHGRRLPALPPLRRRRTQQHPAVVAGLHPLLVHDGRALPLPGRPVPVHQAGSQGLPHADDRPLLPLHRRGQRRCWVSGRLLRPDGREAVLPRPGRGLDRRRGGAAAAEEEDQQPDGGSPMTPTRGHLLTSGPVA
jgi:MFS family permease